MQGSLINFGVKHYLQYRYRRIEAIHHRSPQLQQDLYKRLVAKLATTAIGKDYGIVPDLDIEAFRHIMPIVSYEALLHYIDRSVSGEADVLYPGIPKYFAKSSGTTNARSKYIPVTDDMINDNFICSSWDSMTMVYNQRPDTRIFADKSLLMGGTITAHPDNPAMRIGDVSAIMINEMPAIGRPFYTPDFKTAMLEDFELKLERMTAITSTEPVAMFGGVPTWLIVLMKRLLAETGKEHMGEVWPDARLYMHGGVGFRPYREHFDRLFPNGQLDYMEVYNASEGYIGLQDDFASDDMLLMTDNGIYYEFMRLTDYDAGHYEKAMGLSDIEVDTTYVLVMSSVAGLWRYIPGDTVTFTSKAPYRLRVAGRISQFINVFGEEVMVSNTEQAIATICQQFDCAVRDYTVAPVYLSSTTKGRHQWVIEWEKAPTDTEAFAQSLDDYLRSINSDYDAKRSADLALTRLELLSVGTGTFAQWLANRNRLGAQVKVPRLSNSREFVEEVLAFRS